AATNAFVRRDGDFEPAAVRFETEVLARAIAFAGRNVDGLVMKHAIAVCRGGKRAGTEGEPCEQDSEAGAREAGAEFGVVLPAVS
ncbi:MAG TPA: hypothetical protein VJ724_14375, partial [Tahibacter sp.]|nr:hypothetical protein [Tahibacter sp.]